MRWLRPPPQRPAYFSSSLKPGVVLRVSARATPVPSSSATKRAVAVAIPDSRIARLRAVRSPATKAVAGPSSRRSVWPATTASPSATNSWTVTAGSSS